MSRGESRGESAATQQRSVVSGVKLKATRGMATPTTTYAHSRKGCWVAMARARALAVGYSSCTLARYDCSCAVAPLTTSR